MEWRVVALTTRVRMKTFPHRRKKTMGGTMVKEVEGDGRVVEEKEEGNEGWKKNITKKRKKI